MINTIPNQITAGRLLLTLVLYVLLAMMDSAPGAEDPAIAKWAFIVFVVAAASDFLDGYLARQMNQISPLGRILDPFVDKLLVCGAMVFLCSLPQTREFLRPWVVVIVLLREFLVTGLRGIVEIQGKSFEADIFGKIKMGLQCIAVAVLLFHAAWGGMDVAEGDRLAWTPMAARIFVWAMLISTVFSGIIYAFRARGRFSLEKLP